MTWPGRELCCWGIAVAGLVTAAIRSRAAVPHPVQALGVLPVPLPARMLDETQLSNASDTVSVTDVFRIARQPSNLAFGAPPPSTVPVASPPRIPLRLSGIIGGPPWRAVLEGIPGHDGSVIVNVGDTLAGLKVRRIRHDTVVVVGPDTTWILTTRLNK